MSGIRMRGDVRHEVFDHARGKICCEARSGEYCNTRCDVHGDAMRRTPVHAAKRAIMGTAMHSNDCGNAHNVERCDAHCDMYEVR
jgi:hypothetical protein